MIIPLFDQGAKWYRNSANIIRGYGPRIMIQLLVAVANLLMIQVAGRALPIEEFGSYTLVLAANGFVILILFQPITEGLNRFVCETNKTGQQEELKRLAAQLLLVASGFMLTIYLGGVVGATLLGILPHNVNVNLLVLMPAFFFFYALASILATYFNARARYKFYLLTGAAIPLLGALLALITGKLLRSDATSIILAQTIATIVILTLVFILRFPSIKSIAQTLMRAPSANERGLRRAFLKFIASIPFLGLATYVTMFGDRIAVAQYFSLHEVGEYSYMYVLTMNVVLASFSIYSSSTYLYSVEKLSHATTIKARIHAVDKFFWLSLMFPLFFLPLLPLYFFFDKQIVHFIFGQAAHVPHGGLPLVLFAAVFFGGGMQLSLVSNLLKRQDELIFPRWILVVLLIAAIVFYHPTLFSICLDLFVVNGLYFGFVAFIANQKIRQFSARLQVGDL